MFIFSFLIQYFLMPPIMVDSFENITNNIGKVYLSIIMGLFMVLVEIFMHDMHYGIVSFTKYGIIISMIILFIYLYRNQVAIKDKEFLKGMIEHHSMAVFMSEEILKKTDDYHIAKLAKNIIQTQNDELKEMKELLQK
jgi:membrane-bound ClpP family serine protease